jgi:3',5'-cyclic AMP phosphodiesterase CpdA
MANFRLMHITDLHIAVPPEGAAQQRIWKSRESVYPSCARRYQLKAIAQFLDDYRADADLVLISGDVADDGEDRNLKEALGFIAAPVKTAGFQPTLDAERRGGPPFFIIPGNHDRFEGKLRKPGGRTFDKRFGSYS